MACKKSDIEDRNDAMIEFILLPLPLLPTGVSLVLLDQCYVPACRLLREACANHRLFDSEELHTVLPK